MSYRDDHEAAISRIAALEQELAQARESAHAASDRDQRRIDMLEREIGELRRTEPSAPRRARAPSTPPVPRPHAVTEPIDERARKGPPVSRAMLVVFGLFTALVVALAVKLAGGSSDPKAPAAARPKNCVVRSSPEHARVFGITGMGREVDLGVAPVDLTFYEWRRYNSIQFRLAGYASLDADAPYAAEVCAADAYELVR